MKTLLIIATALAAMGAVGWLAGRYGPRLGAWLVAAVSQRAWP